MSGSCQCSVLLHLQDLTAAERSYIDKQLGPEDRVFADWAKAVVDRVGPVSEFTFEGDMVHRCDWLPFTWLLWQGQGLDRSRQHRPVSR